MQLIRTIILTLLAFPAYAQDASLRYAVLPDLATAQALSASAWAAVRCGPPGDPCDKAQVTKEVYPIIGLTNGKYAIQIRSDDVYQGERLTLPNGKSFSLTAGQIASLQTRAQAGTLLGDILPVATVAARLTAPQTAAITAYANTHLAFKANYTALTSGPIDLQAPLLMTVLTELKSAGIVTDADITAVTTPVATAVVP